MTSLISIRANYLSDPDAVFANACSFERLRGAMRGLATYHGLPERGDMIEGQTYRTDIWFWRLLPVRNHIIKVERLSIADRLIQTSEAHAGVSTWTHQVKVDQLNDHAIWVDQIRIKAGSQTPFVARFARYVYLRRHHAQGATTTESSLTAQRSQAPSG